MVADPSNGIADKLTNRAVMIADGHRKSIAGAAF
jgi:hypothetical protein